MENSIFLFFNIFEYFLGLFLILFIIFTAWGAGETGSGSPVGSILVVVGLMLTGMGIAFTIYESYLENFYLMSRTQWLRYFQIILYFFHPEYCTGTLYSYPLNFNPIPMIERLQLTLDQFNFFDVTWLLNRLFEDHGLSFNNRVALYNWLESLKEQFVNNQPRPPSA